MIERLKNWKTSLIGIIVIVCAITGFFLKIIDGATFGTLIALGYTYIVAKDTLLNGVTGGLTKQ
jgi:hypothetical protein